MSQRDSKNLPTFYVLRLPVIQLFDSFLAIKKLLVGLLSIKRGRYETIILLNNYCISFFSVDDARPRPTENG